MNEAPSYGGDGDAACEQQEPACCRGEGAVGTPVEQILEIPEFIDHMTMGAATTAAGVWVWSRSAVLALIIGLSMVLSMVIAGLSGAIIPILLTRLRQDPAQSSSIVLTTVTDVTGFLSFLGIATLLLGVT